MKEDVVNTTGSEEVVESTAKANNIDAIVIHCTADPENTKKKMEDIKAHHLSLGWVDIGYNYIIELDGTIKTGRSLDIEGAHCSYAGSSGISYNKHSIGVCYIGGTDLNRKPKDTRTSKQKQAMHKLIQELCAQYNIKEIIGHRDASKDQNGDGIVSSWEWQKQCPSFDVIPEFSQYISRT